MKKRRVLDLFSGIGGISLGLDRTGGFEPAAFCEANAYCRRVLARHWPNVRQYEDVRELTADRLRADGISVDGICGGFPCQDTSDAGTRIGIGGERSGLWKEYARLIDELRPSFIVVENTRGLLSRGFATVLGDLAAIGYDAWWDRVPASALGAPHPRERIWLVAYPAALRRDEGQRAEEEWRRLVLARQLDSETPWSCRENNHEVRSGFLRIVDGLPHRVDRLGALGNAAVPQIPEVIGHAILAGFRQERAAA